MLSFKGSSKIAILVLSVLASFIDGKNSKASFTLHQLESGSSGKYGPPTVSSTHHKLSRRAPGNIRDAAAINRGTVIASPYRFDAEYLTPITIGGQTLNLVIDTGSDLLWAFSSDFASSTRSTYNSLISNTSRLQEGYTWGSCYNDGSCAAGDVFTETVSVGDIVVNNQTIGVAREVNSRGVSLMGFLGLSFNQKSLKMPQYTTFFDNIKSTLSVPLFTADLKKGIPGSYDFGFIDDSKYTGQMTYVPVDKSQGFWGLTLNGYAVGTENIIYTPVQAIADTGTSLIYLPEQLVNNYYAGIPSAYYNSTVAGFLFPCDATLPSITFDIGGYHAVVPGSFMKYMHLDLEETICYGGIQPAVDSDLSTLGDVFLKSQFVVFDAGNEPRLGFAPKPL